MSRSARPFPFWVGFATWLFLALTIVTTLGVVALDGLGFTIEPLDAAVALLPGIPAGMFLLQDWAWHREDTRRPR